MTLAEMKAAPSETDWERLRYEAEHGVEPVLDEEDLLLKEGEWRSVNECPLTKERTPIRLDPDIIEALKARVGPGWEVVINMILRDALNLP